MGVIRGDTRSIDHSSHEPQAWEGSEGKDYPLLRAGPALKTPLVLRSL